MPSSVRTVSAGTRESDGPSNLTRGTLLAASLGACVGQVALAIPAVFNGLFQQDLHTTSSQLTWISAAFLVPVTLFELTFGVLGDLFGRKRMLVGGALLLALGELISALTPGSSTSSNVRVGVLWTGQIISGIGAAALFATTLAMVAAGTHTANHRARSIAIWAAALSAGGFISPVLGGLVAEIPFGSEPERELALGFHLGDRAGSGGDGGVGRRGAEFLRTRGTIIGLARTDHHRGSGSSRCCSRSSRARPAGGTAHG